MRGEQQTVRKLWVPLQVHQFGNRGAEDVSVQQTNRLRLRWRQRQSGWWTASTRRFSFLNVSLSSPDHWPLIQEPNSLQTRRRKTPSQYHSHSFDGLRDAFKNPQFVTKIAVFSFPATSVPAVVDFPTPPLPEATTMTCLTPAMGFCLGRPLAMCCFCLSCSTLLSTDRCNTNGSTFQSRLGQINVLNYDTKLSVLTNKRATKYMLWKCLSRNYSNTLFLRTTLMSTICISVASLQKYFQALIADNVS